MMRPTADDPREALRWAANERCWGDEGYPDRFKPSPWDVYDRAYMRLPP